MLMRTCLLLLSITFSTSGGDVQAFAGSEARAIVVVVNKDNKAKNVDAKALARIYKGQKKNWSSGQKAVPINRPADSEIRESFYRAVLKTEPTQKFYLSGDPRPVRVQIQKSSLAVKRFVLRIPGAIGYIYLDELDESVKALATIEAGEYEPQS